MTTRFAPSADLRATLREATLSEIFFPRAVDAAGVAFALGMIGAGKPILWIQDRLSRKETGRPYLAGMPHPVQILHVDVSRPVDVLWAMEEGLRCRALGAVLGEVWGDAPALDFTATKRLALRSEAHQVPAFLLRRAATEGLSAARNRWRVSSLPSLNAPYDNRAPGQPQWRAELFRSRWARPGDWVAEQQADGIGFSHGIAAMQPEAESSHA